MKVVNKRTHTPTPQDVYIGRPSVFGNPYSHIPHGTLAQFLVKDRDEAIAKYTEYLVNEVKVVKNPILIKALLSIPEDANLVCWCAPARCHGDIIIKACEYLHKQEKGTK